ncbi:MAG: hypothetical protein OEV95_01980 [Gemmatimonadota bacterium]|jgi:hypothetical protein|nr:hypothetical protein [Gemmatimonadota bacterium]
MRKYIHRTLPALGLALFAMGCGSNNNNALAPQFQPEVVNTPNVAFSFQATGLTDISDALSYTWSVSSGSIVIHPATNTSGGTVTLNIKDAGGAVVYNGPVPATGDIAPPAGSAGPWKVRITLVQYSGTINFALQMQ